MPEVLLIDPLLTRTRRFFPIGGRPKQLPVLIAPTQPEWAWVHEWIPGW